MKESFEQKKRRLYGRKYLKQYLMELSSLLQVQVHETDLLSIVDTDAILSAIKDVPLSKGKEFKILHNSKQELKMLIIGMNEMNSRSAYLFTEHYFKDCGILKIQNIAALDINNLEFDIWGDITKVIVEDGSNKVIFDYCIEDGEEIISIRIFGEDWSKVIL